MPSYRFDGVTPVVSPEAYVHPTAVLIGDVIIEAGVYIGPCASLRADFGRIHVKKNANIQDNCTVHGFPNSITLIDEMGHIGHGAILHGCQIAKNVLIGMNSVILDEAVIGENSVIGAQSLVKAKANIAANVLALGSPARVIRDLSESERKWKTLGTQQYMALAQRSLASMQEVEPLSEDDPQRKTYLDFESDYHFKPKP
ncbi:phenylacetic acid degradation protein [Acinetobacter calcoaceticus]|uniref:Phenylacetic acid degradation protein n=1 Tax=Acinetobacter calcoaceticus TaxID=471 RepID=A0A4V2QZZ7_ACICA|nr:phenylacetic acid degradation protein [Acinetobacter calcoaceticus]